MSVSGSLSRVLPDRTFCTAIAMAHRRFEHEMIPIVSACDPAGIALDVGAWYGPWTYWLSKRVEQVIAFEPNPAVASTLRGWVGPNVEVREEAVSARAERLHLAVTGKHRSEEGRSYIDLTEQADHLVDVQAVTLDELGLERVRLVKIDVEGHELAALQGATDLLERCHPVLVVEVESRFGEPRPVFDLLTSLGYRARVLRNRTWQRTSVEELSAMQMVSAPAGGYLGMVVRRGNGYVNNVVFAHADSTWVPW
jgi:FkbM family methyltransferase